MYVDQADYSKAKKDANKMKREFGIKSDVKVVDKDYAYVPTNVSQSAKGGQANVRKASEMNMKRFGLDS